jgi:GntR family transcriptional regulator
VSAGAGSTGDAPARRALLGGNGDSAVPLYYRLAGVIQSRIASGAWAPGRRMPSERELCEEFAVSRAVVRPALEILERDGVIRREQGRGTFVAPPKRLVPVRGIVAMLAGGIGEDTEMHILDASMRSPDSQIAGVFDIGQGQDLFHTSAVISTDGRPQYICNSTIVPDHVPWLPAMLRPRARLSGVGSIGDVDLGLARARLEIGVCPDFEAEQLGVPAGTSVLLGHVVERLASAPGTGADAAAIESAWLIYAADSVALDIVLERPDAP